MVRLLNSWIVILTNLLRTKTSNTRILKTYLRLKPQILESSNPRILKTNLQLMTNDLGLTKTKSI